MFGPSDQGLSIRFSQYRNKVNSQFQDTFISIGDILIRDTRFNIYQ
jgi:dimeric dUTPase (all-alpha-NTP-PPase superfamily)